MREALDKYRTLCCGAKAKPVCFMMTKCSKCGAYVSSNFIDFIKKEYNAGQIGFNMNGQTIYTL